VPHNNFNLLRLLAAVAVLFSHGEFLYRLHMPVPFPGHSLGAVAVYVFFFVSGYLIAQSWARSHGWRDFTAKRVGRIFPGLIVATAFSVVVIGAAMTTLPQADYWRHPTTWLNLVNNAFGMFTVQVLPGVFEHNPFARAVNGSLWTIRYELLMYALLAVISYLGIRRFRSTYIVFASILAATWLLAQHLGWPDAPAAAPDWFNDLFSLRQATSLGVYFFIGSAFAQARLERFMRGSALWGMALMAVLGIAGLALARWGTQAMPIQIGLWIGLPCATFFLAHLGSDALRGRPHTDLSYGVYIYAFPIQQAMTQIGLAQGWSLAVCLGLSLGLTLAMAALSWFGVEKPAIVLTRRWLSESKSE
jgi:peptidoglycan/LPS O-acetylase OafA/YrhL